MEISRNKGSFGSLGGGCFLLVFVGAAWAICAAIFPKLPDYEKVMQDGEVVAGEVVREEKVNNVTINGKNPRRVHYHYGEGKKGSMTLALGQSASKGKIEVRVLGDIAYPVGLRPLAQPKWLKYAFIGGLIFASLILVGGIIRLLFLGGILVTAGHALLKDKNSEKPPPLSPGPPPSSPPGPPPSTPPGPPPGPTA